MKHLLALSLLFTVYTGLFLGCDSVDPALPDTQEANQAPGQEPRNVVEEILLNNFVVQYEGRTFNQGSNQTTFNYTVTAEQPTPALSHFAIELLCQNEPIAFVPSNSVTIKTDQDTGIYGVEWHPNARSTAELSFGLTFAGAVYEGRGRIAVKSNAGVEVAVFPVPCGVADVGGRLFVDADEDGVLGATELGIADVTVQLLGAGGSLAGTTRTDAQGAYVFLDKPAGVYAVNVPASTAAADFNETLFDASTYTGDASEVNAGGITRPGIAIGPDSFANHFGFTLLPQKLVQKLEDGELVTEGRTPKEWAKIVRAGKRTNDASVLALLNTVEALYLPVPFDLDDANPFDQALAILTTTSKAEIDLLAQQLLAAEMNVVSGLALQNVPGLNEYIIEWAEGVYNELLSTTSKQSSVQAAQAVPTADAIRLLTLINGSGGGQGN